MNSALSQHEMIIARGCCRPLATVGTRTRFQRNWLLSTRSAETGNSGAVFALSICVSPY